MTLNVVEDWQDCASESKVYRTFTIMDDAGNSYSQTQTISFEDNTPPSFTFVPDSYTVGCPEEINLEDPMFEDNCSFEGGGLNISDEIQNQVCNERFNLVRTFLIEDACGNETTAQQIISVWDDIAPELATPLDSR